MENNSAYWLDIVDYDLATAEAMYSTGRWLYGVYVPSSDRESHKRHIGVALKTMTRLISTIIAVWLKVVVFGMI